MLQHLDVSILIGKKPPILPPLYKETEANQQECLRNSYFLHPTWSPSALDVVLHHQLRDQGWKQQQTFMNGRPVPGIILNTSQALAGTTTRWGRYSPFTDAATETPLGKWENSNPWKSPECPPSFGFWLGENKGKRTFPGKFSRRRGQRWMQGLGQVWAPKCYPAFIFPISSRRQASRAIFVTAIIGGHLSQSKWTGKGLSPLSVPSLLLQHLLLDAGSSWSQWAGTQADQYHVHLRTFWAQY